jgi:hypothetical protein
MYQQRMSNGNMARDMAVACPFGTVQSILSALLFGTLSY